MNLFTLKNFGPFGGSFSNANAHAGSSGAGSNQNPSHNPQASGSGCHANGSGDANHGTGSGNASSSRQASPTSPGGCGSPGPYSGRASPSPFASGGTNALQQTSSASSPSCLGSGSACYNYVNGHSQRSAGGAMVMGIDEVVTGGFRGGALRRRDGNGADGGGAGGIPHIPNIPSEPSLSETSFVVRNIHHNTGHRGGRHMEGTVMSGHGHGHPHGASHASGHAAPAPAGGSTACPQLPKGLVAPLDGPRANTAAAAAAAASKEGPGDATGAASKATVAQTPLPSNAGDSPSGAGAGAGNGHRHGVGLGGGAVMHKSPLLQSSLELSDLWLQAKPVGTNNSGNGTSSALPSPTSHSAQPSPSSQQHAQATRDHHNQGAHNGGSASGEVGSSALVADGNSPLKVDSSRYAKKSGGGVKHSLVPFKTSKGMLSPLHLCSNGTFAYSPSSSKDLQVVPHKAVPVT